MDAECRLRRAILPILALAAALAPLTGCVAGAWRRPSGGEARGAADAAPPPAAEVAVSHLGHAGPLFKPGVTPSRLGWGPDDRPYPDRMVVNARDGAEMRWIPPGEFLMGTTREQAEGAAAGTFKKDELPAHRVLFTKGCWMYRHEVTNEQFRRFRPSHDSGAFRGLSVNAERMPAVSLPWQSSQDYCDWAGVRLPTEAEWEYACRAGGVSLYTWGDDERAAGRWANVSDVTAKAKWADFDAFKSDDGLAVSAAVGAFPANGWGLQDMLGNVWEWCADWYAADYYARSPAADPRGPEQGKHRVLRGGSWFSGPKPTRCAARFQYYPEDICPGRGFRCCVTP